MAVLTGVAAWFAVAFAFPATLIIAAWIYRRLRYHAEVRETRALLDTDPDYADLEALAQLVLKPPALDPRDVELWCRQVIAADTDRIITEASA